MIQYYVLSNKYKLTNSIEKKRIGVYSSIEEAENEKYRLMKQEGFVDYSNGFMIKRVFRLYNPQFLNKTFWDGGFLHITTNTNYIAKLFHMRRLK